MSARDPQLAGAASTPTNDCHSIHQEKK